MKTLTKLKTLSETKGKQIKGTATYLDSDNLFILFEDDIFILLYVDDYEGEHFVSVDRWLGEDNYPLEYDKFWPNVFVLEQNILSKEEYDSYFITKAEERKKLHEKQERETYLRLKEKFEGK